MSTASTKAIDHRAMCLALLDFHRMPGRYPVALREPRAVFDRQHEVLALAAGRRVDGLGLDAEMETQVRQAARFFVRTAMLRPGADHYTLLGVTPGFEAEVLRNHYRLMIRMMHPDFLTSGESWPPDAAARINIANDVLSSTDMRDAYIATLVTTRHTDSAGALVRSLTAPAPLPRRVQNTVSGGRLKRRHDTGRRCFSSLGPYASAGLAGIAVLGGLLIWPPAEDDSLTVARTLPTGQTAVAPNPALSAPNPTEAWAPEQASAATESVTLVAAIQPPVAVTRPVKLAGLSTSLSIPSAQLAIPEAPLQALGPAVNRPDTAVAPVPDVGGATANDDANRGIRLIIDSRLQRPPVELLPAVAVAVSTAGERPVNPAPTDGAGRVIHMSQVQPVLSNVTASLQSGSADDALQWIDRSSRNDELAAQFVAKFQQTLAGARVTGLGQVRFTPRFAAEQLVVDGVVQLRLLDAQQQTSVKDFHLRAYFRSQGSGPVLARLVAE